MTVLGFVAGIFVTRRLCRSVGLDPEVISNAALYCLVVGMVGARTFFVIHYYDQFRGDFAGVFAVWRGGLEFLGGVIPAIVFLLLYLRHRGLPVRRYFDIMAIGLMVGLSFGRIGCFLNGCCFGRPTEVPWAVRFPYRSYAYLSQINADPKKMTNAVLRQDAIVSARLPLDAPDQCQEDVLNHILWRAMKGPDVPYPDWAVQGVDIDVDGRETALSPRKPKHSEPGTSLFRMHK